MPLSTFSKVDVDNIDMSEYEDEKKPEPVDPTQGMVPEGMYPGPPGGAPLGMGGGFDMGDGLPDDYPGAMSMDEFHLNACQERDVGKTFTVSKGNKTIKKKLLAAGSGFDNPKETWEVELRYTGRVAGDGGAVFDGDHAENARRLTMGDGALPSGAWKAVRTMLVGEKCLVTLQPEAAFGDDGDAARGVGGGAVVEYEVELVKMVEVSTLGGGLIEKKLIQKGDGWETPQDGAEVSVTFRGELLDGTPFQPEGVFHYIAGDKAIPSFWGAAVSNKMKKGEVAELVVQPQARNSAAQFGAILERHSTDAPPSVRRWRLATRATRRSACRPPPPSGCTSLSTAGFLPTTSRRQRTAAPSSARSSRPRTRGSGRLTSSSATSTTWCVRRAGRARARRRARSSPAGRSPPSRR